MRLIDANKLYIPSEEMISAMIIASAPTVFDIPENPTNGDMIKALFPNAKNIRVDGGYPLNYIIEGEWHRNLKDWWDAPYGGDDNADSN